MGFYEDQMESRGYCPADWVWLVPPSGGSMTKMFHQEMVCWFSTPCYRDQTRAWIEAGGPSEPSEVTIAASATESVVVPISRKAQHVYILYGSETGGCGSIARNLKRRFKHLPTDQLTFCTLNTFDSVAAVDSDMENLLLVVTSTFFTGNAPTNASNFLDSLNQNGAIFKKHASGTSFAVLAVGSTAYKGTFCKFGVDVDAELERAGCNRIQGVAFADSIGLTFDADVASWIENAASFDVPTELTATTESIADQQQVQKKEHHVKLVSKSSNTADTEPAEAAMATFISKTMLDDQLMLISFDHPGFKADIGYHINIFPENSTGLVEAALRRVTVDGKLLDGDQLVTVDGFEGSVTVPDGGSINVTTLLKKAVRLNGVSTNDQLRDAGSSVQPKPELEEVPEHDPDSFFGKIAEHGGSSSTSESAPPRKQRQSVGWRKLKQQTAKMSSLGSFAEGRKRNVMRMVSGKFSKGVDISKLSLLSKSLPSAEPKPRYEFDEFECADDPPMPDRQIDLADLIEHSTWTHPRKYTIASNRPDGFDLLICIQPGGFCSEGYLATLKEGDRVQFSVSVVDDYAKHRDGPVLVIGAGSGASLAASFLDYWQTTEDERAVRGQLRAYLGFRGKQPSLLESTFSPALEGAGMLRLGFSRNLSAKKEYVQDLLVRDSAWIGAVLEDPNACVYVCGGHGMSQGVKSVLIDIIGQDRLSEMVRDGRYVVEVFGAK
jgi:sulfite reductase alpha subunit-like flavoprotein